MISKGRMCRALFAAFVVIGVALIGAGIVRYSEARRQQERDQAALDRHWNEVQREAAQNRILPGEERPQPARMAGMGIVITLTSSGAALFLGGIVGLFSSHRSARRDE